METVDPILIQTAKIIADDKMTYEEKTEAIWTLFQDRRKKEKQTK